MDGWLQVLSLWAAWLEELQTVSPVWTEALAEDDLMISSE